MIYSVSGKCLYVGNVSVYIIMKYAYGSLLAKMNHFTFTQDYCNIFFPIYYITVYSLLYINEMSAIKRSPVSCCHNDVNT